ncbi:hypothetical protein L345_13990, partial [Ophiophagus hannah]
SLTSPFTNCYSFSPFSTLQAVSADRQRHPSARHTTAPSMLSPPPPAPTTSPLLPPSPNISKLGWLAAIFRCRRLTLRAPAGNLLSSLPPTLQLDPNGTSRCPTLPKEESEGTLGSQAQAHSSCVGLRTKEIGIRQLSDYEIHHHPQKVVILITRNRVKVCVPHDAAWVIPMIVTVCGKINVDRKEDQVEKDPNNQCCNLNLKNLVERENSICDIQLVCLELAVELNVDSTYKNINSDGCSTLPSVDLKRDGNRNLNLQTDTIICLEGTLRLNLRGTET